MVAELIHRWATKLAVLTLLTWSLTASGYCDEPFNEADFAFSNLEYCL